MTRGSMPEVVVQHQHSFVRKLHDDYCPGWVDIYQGMSNPGIVTHSMNGLCTGITEMSPEQQVRADYPPMICSCEL